MWLNFQNCIKVNFFFTLNFKKSGIYILGDRKNCVTKKNNFKHQYIIILLGGGVEITGSGVILVIYCCFKFVLKTLWLKPTYVSYLTASGQLSVSLAGSSGSRALTVFYQDAGWSCSYLKARPGMALFPTSFVWLLAGFSFSQAVGQRASVPCLLLAEGCP